MFNIRIASRVLLAALSTARASSLGALVAAVPNSHTDYNSAVTLQYASMPSHGIIIGDADAERSGVLGRMRLDGVGRVTVPFGERLVHAWRCGVPDPGMDVDTMVNVLSVRCFALWNVSCVAHGARCCALAMPAALPRDSRAPGHQPHAHVKMSVCLQLAHFLEADLKPWAAALAAALFSGAAVPSTAEQPGDLVQGCTAAADTAAASSNNVVLWEDAWRRLDELAPLGDAVDAVLRAWRLPLLEQLPHTPAEWQLAVIGSHAVAGALAVSYDTAAACRGAMHAVHAVHSLTVSPPAAPQQVDLALHAVASMPALRSLKFLWDTVHYSSLMDQHALAELLTRLSQLEGLRIADTAIDATALAKPLGTLTALTALELTLCVAGTGVAALAPALTRLSRLADLRLGYPMFGGYASAAVLAQPLGTLTALTALALLNCGVTAHAARALMPALSHLSSLVDLRLVQNTFGATSTHALAQPLSALTTLTVLELAECEIGAAGIQVLAPALSRLSRLADLHLGCNEFGEAGAAALAQPLGTLTALTALHLGADEIGDTGAQALAPALSHLSRLASLRLSNNGIGAAGAAALARPLGGLTALTALDMSGNEVGGAGAGSLAPALSRLKRLAELDLGQNNIGDAGAAALAQPLGALPALTALQLNGSDISGRGVESLAPALSRLSRLAELLLNDNRIGDAGAAALAQPLGGLTALTKLVMTSNAISAVSAESLTQALRHLPRLADLHLR